MSRKTLFKVLRGIAWFALFLLWLAMFVGPLFAAPAQCAARADVIRQLQQKYGEQQLLYGSVTSDTMFELWGRVGASWTLLFTKPDGTSCLVAAGHNLREAPKADAKKAPKGDPA